MRWMFNCRCYMTISLRYSFLTARDIESLHKSSKHRIKPFHLQFVFLSLGKIRHNLTLEIKICSLPKFCLFLKFHHDFFFYNKFVSNYLSALVVNQNLEERIVDQFQTTKYSCESEAAKNADVPRTMTSYRPSSFYFFLRTYVIRPKIGFKL